MQPAQYQRIRAIFHAAHDFDAASREKYLEDACNGDTELRANVERLLHANERSDRFLEAPVLDANQILVGAESAAALPERIGRYRVLRLLGEGGMGCVYEAEQDSPQRRVALKVLRAGALVPRMMQRFQREVEVLGRLQHPGIARIYEAGTANVARADGRSSRVPFFAMELIDGQPITRHAETQRLDVRSRLALLAGACDAVHFGHTHGVIHRDLKPANILVIENQDADRGTGSRAGPASDSMSKQMAAASPTNHAIPPNQAVCKIIDFGVARVTDADLALTTMATDAGQIIGTLAYMSPEQVLGDVRNIDERSDVYALGVVGYELLTGRLPYDVADRAAPEAARIIRDDEPSRLSSISRHFRGDIETIFAKALEKEPSRRYASVAAMAADIRRYLDDEPIIARPPTLTYQIRKFARRHKELVASLALVFIVLLAGIVGTTTGWIRARNALKFADNRSTAAERQAARADLIKSMVTRMLGSANPDGIGSGRDARVADVLDRFAADIGTTLRDQPDVEIEIRSVLADTYYNLALWNESIDNYQQALRLADQTLEPEAETRLKIAAGLANVLCGADRNAEGEQVARLALELANRRLGPQHPTSMALTMALGRSIAGQGRSDPARFEESLQILLPLVSDWRTQPVSPDRDHALVSALYYTAWVHERQHNTFEAERELHEAIELAQERDGPERSDRRGAIRSLLALVMLCHGRIEESCRLQREVLADRQRTLGPTNELTMQSLRAAIIVLCGLNRHAQAMPLIDECLADCRLHVDQAPERLADVMVTRASALATLGQSRAAVEQYTEAIGLRRKAGGDADAMAIAFWRAASVDLGLGPNRQFKSEAIQIALDRTRDAVQGVTPRTFALDEMQWDNAQFTLTKWNPANDLAAPDAPSSAVQGDLQQLRTLDDPSPGVYRLTTTILVDGQEPITCERWLHVADWKVRSFALDEGWNQSPKWNDHSSAPDDRKFHLPLLGWMTGPYDASYGPGGAPAFFGLVATTISRAPPGEYQLSVEVDDAVRMWVNGELIIDDWQPGIRRTNQRTLTLRGEDKLRVVYFQGRGGSVLHVDLVPLRPMANVSSAD